MVARMSSEAAPTWSWYFPGSTHVVVFGGIPVAEVFEGDLDFHGLRLAVRDVHPLEPAERFARLGNCGIDVLEINLHDFIAITGAGVVHVETDFNRRQVGAASGWSDLTDLYSKVV